MKTQPATPAKSASFDGVTGWHSLDWAKGNPEKDFPVLVKYTDPVARVCR
ncbi:hypothetical protein [Azotobacter chroococcum]|uniref:Uncharacterized protein n=1 Tax=Azotobacter chroococcum TaxID=353 RepID=A0AAQ0BZU3_9GAMM|nr:hypothetical protein [Azotobacter chroococcum]QQE88526.1 hypothetical protein GKQ51_20205 [Azotobacter chroococcum]